MADELQENLATYKLQLQQVKTGQQMMWLNFFECFVNAFLVNDRVELDSVDSGLNITRITGACVERKKHR